MVDIFLRLLSLFMFIICLLATMFSFINAQYIFMIVSAIISAMWWEIFVTFN